MNNRTMHNDQQIFADNAAPFNTIKLLSAGGDGCVKQHIVDISALNSTVSKESQLIAQSTKSVTVVKQETCRITSIAMNTDTHTLFAANDRGIITQFQKEESSLNYYPVKNLKGHINGICSISLANSKMQLLSAGIDGTLRVWDLQKGDLLVCLNMKRKEHSLQILSTCWHGHLLASLTDESEKRSLQILSCCWNNADTLFASGDFIGVVVVWSPPLSIYNASNKFIPLLKFQAGGDNSFILCLKFQENGLDLFASYQTSGIIRLWSINEKELLKKNKSKHWHYAATLPLIEQPKRESEKLNGLIKSLDVRGSTLIVGAGKEILQLSADSLQSMADAIKFEVVHNDLIMSLVFNKNCKYVASVSWDQSVAIFNSESGKCVKYVEKAHSGWVRAVVFQN